MLTRPTRVGFTGSSRVVHDEQWRAYATLFKTWVDNGWVEEFHHGDCIFADARAHVYAQDLNISTYIHPPKNPVKRAFCNALPSGFGPKVTIYPARDFLDRNRDIVRSTDVLCAISDTHSEKLRSGTWATIRAAKAMRKPVYIFYPDGLLTVWDPHFIEGFGRALDDCVENMPVKK